MRFYYRPADIRLPAGIAQEAICMDLTEELRNMLLAAGASAVGYADLSDIGAVSRRNFPTGVVIGLAMRPESLEGVAEGPTQAYYAEYRRVNAKLDELARAAAEFLTQKGYGAYARTQDTVHEEPRTLRVELPHKLLAVRAGMGWLGKCARLITEDFGAVMRMSSVLTDAPLRAGHAVTESRCGDCMICQEICPAGAVSGRAWDIESDRDAFFNAFGCRRVEESLSGDAGFDADLCGICRVSCPYTRRYIEAAAGRAAAKCTVGHNV